MKPMLRFEGGQEMARNLALMAQPMSRKIKVEALKKAAEPIREEASILAPRDEDASAPHLDESIVIGTLTEATLERRGRDTETVVEVGPAGGKGGADFFYAHMQEYGTAHHAAQPFMRPAFDSQAPTALEILNDELWWAIRRGLPASSEKF